MNQPFINTQPIETPVIEGVTDRKYYRDREFPEIGHVFVFGSALGDAQIMRASQALTKKQENIVLANHEGYFRDELGNHSYAIPVMNKSLHLLSLEELRIYIANFVGFTKINELTYFVTEIGYSAVGYNAALIAPLFRACGENVILPDAWRQYMN